MLRHPNVKVSVVSIKESRMKVKVLRSLLHLVSVVSIKESRMKRRYEGIDKEREEYRDRWKKKK